jgi:3-oxoacyl-(acyl-carrier-protein) synthase
VTVSATEKRRVVITGLGAVTPLGIDVESTWDALISGRSGAGKITQFDTTGFPVDFACEVPGFEPTTWIDAKAARRMDRFAQLAVAAARQV